MKVVKMYSDARQQRKTQTENKVSVIQLIE